MSYPATVWLFAQKVRCLAVRLVVDEFRLIGPAGSSLALSVLLPKRKAAETKGRAEGKRPRTGDRVGVGGGRGDSEAVDQAGGILERMLGHYELLKETDSER